MKLVDCHAHLDDERFGDELDQVIQRAGAAGVERIITAGVDLASSRTAADLCRQYANLKFTVGIHPQEIKTYHPSDIEHLKRLVIEENPVAVGEIGLDYVHAPASLAAQIRILKSHLELARSTELPVVIHCRGAEKDLIPVLSEWTGASRPEVVGLIHCFSGNVDTAREYIRMGFRLSVGAYIGYPSSRELRETLRQIPMNCLLLETDCPYLPPQKMRGQRNEPAYIVETARDLAGIKGMDVAEIAGQTTENARSLFKLNI